MPEQTFTSGYRDSIVDLRLGKFEGSKSMRYRCLAPERGSDGLLLLLRVFLTFMSEQDGCSTPAKYSKKDVYKRR